MSAVFTVLLIYILDYCLPITSPYGWKHTRSLNGLWRFRISPDNDQDIGFRDKWYSKTIQEDLHWMPVPSSYNDVTSNVTLRNYLGWVWYQTDSVVDFEEWQHFRVVIHFGGVHYYTMVDDISPCPEMKDDKSFSTIFRGNHGSLPQWFGNSLIGEHEGGHVPFEFELKKTKGLITVAVNNTLNNHTLPQGYLTYDGTSGFRTYTHPFDYFDYAGIERNVFLYATSREVYIQSVAVTALPSGLDLGFVSYQVHLGGSGSSNCSVTLNDDVRTFVKKNCSGVFQLRNPILWWSVNSGHMPVGYLHSLTIEIDPGKYTRGENIYRMKVGVRQIEWYRYGLVLNYEKVYLKGFGRHEDSEIRGRGFDWATTVRDVDLLLWSGANAVRTSHYPNSLEFIDLADRKGIMVIIESPACSLSHFDAKLLTRHKEVMSEIYQVYSNHPSVIMWSLANEPSSDLPSAYPYFSDLVQLMHDLDPNRPVTFVTSQHVDKDKAVSTVDVVCLNRYFGWYSLPGAVDEAAVAISTEILTWKHKYPNVSVIITEYGAGSIAGYHTLPGSMWTEDYQSQLFQSHFKAFDQLRAKANLVGEMVWVFADFATPQEYIRPGGCMKGVFTRNRQPKSGAFTIRQRYVSLKACTELDNSTSEVNTHTMT